MSLYAYAASWEDADLLLHRLDGRVPARALSIASGGDNTLALLPHVAERVLAVDTEAAQLHLLRLKVAGLRHLERERFLGFFGELRDANRVGLYRALRSELPPDTRAYWDYREAALAHGLQRHGKLDRYFDAFRRYVRPLIHPRALAEELLTPKSPDAQLALFRGAWDTPRWRLLFRLFFGRATMSLLGRSPAKFAHVEEDLAEALRRRAARHLSSPHAQGNGFLHYLLVGGYGPYLPRYLRPGTYESIGRHLGKLHLHHGPLDSVSERGFGLANLSNVFEYMSPSAAAANAGWLARHCAPGADLLYWNLMVPRRLATLDASIRPVAEFGEGRADWGFFYARFLHDRVRATPPEPRRHA